MKTISHFIRNKTALILPALSVVVFARMVPADEQETARQQGQAYRQAVAQEALQKDLTAAQAELATLRGEMKELLPGDVAMIDRAFRQIDSLSANEMKATIDSLRAASRSGDLKTELVRLSDAFQNQTTAVSEIKRISGDLSERRISDDMIAKLDGILKRQAAGMDEVARIAQANQPPAALTDALMRRHQVAGGEQVAVTDDVNICIQEITDAAANLPEEARKPMADAGAIITRQKLAETAASAVALTRDGPFDQAVAAQAATVDSLAMVIHSLSSDQQTLEQLRQISADLGTMSDEQKQVAGTMQAERRTFAYALQMRQVDLSDSATALRAEVQALNSQAADEVRQGRDSMEKVVSIASRGHGADKAAIAPAQQYAVDELDAAKRDLDKQIAGLEAALRKESIADAGAPSPADGGTNPGDALTADSGQQGAAGAPTQGDPANDTGQTDAGAPGQGGPAAGPGQGGPAAGAGQQGAGAQGVENTTMTGTGQVAGGGTPGGLNYVAGFGRRDVGSVQVVTGLNSHDRTAVALLQGEKPPREYAPDVQQYYRNLADGAGL